MPNPQRFMYGLACAWLAPPALLAQQPGRVHRIGWLQPTTEAMPLDQIRQQTLRVIARVQRHQVPTAFGHRRFVQAGGLMSYVSSDAWHWRKAASFIDKILKGAKPAELPAELPVEQPTEFELVINLLAAKALGITLPTSLLLRADEVIQ